MLRLFFFNDPAPTKIYTLSLHDALPISLSQHLDHPYGAVRRHGRADSRRRLLLGAVDGRGVPGLAPRRADLLVLRQVLRRGADGGLGEGVEPRAGPPGASGRPVISFV